MNGFALVALGANLPGACGGAPEASCVWAAGLLMRLPGVTSAVRSRWFSSAPQPPSAQPRYINGIVRLGGTLDPAALLLACQDIEAKAGRERGAPNAARTLDVDIIDVDGLLRTAPDPILPHPRAHLRGFVLLPLRDVAPGWVHPRLGQDVQALMAALPEQDIRPVR